MNLLFNELNISEQTKAALEHLGLVETTSIQHFAIPKLLEHKDIIGQAQTGTGKTFAFAIPILEQIDITSNHVQAMVVCPTRELAVQVYKEILKLVKFNLQVRVASIYGGESYTKQFRALEKHPHIVVATPGRAIDHLDRKTMDLSNLKILVLDEADEMLKMGFQEDLEKLLKDTPRERQTALFSATIPPFIKQVAVKYQKSPEFIQIKAPTLTVDKIEQFYYNVKKQDRDQLLMRVIDQFDPDSAIIFCNTKLDVDDLTKFLQKNHYEADAIHGDLKQSQRDDVMNRYRSRRLKYLVATDVAARGLDISHVDMIVNYELPFESEIYIHRIGRTARAGRKGVSISLVYPSMRGKLDNIQRLIKTELIELKYPKTDEINQKRYERSISKLEDVIVHNHEEHEDLMNKLVEKGYTLEKIAHAFISQFKVEPKVYEDIEEPASKRQQKNVRTTRDERSNPRDDRQRSKEDKPKFENTRKNDSTYAYAKINLGSSDGLRPVQLLDYFRKNADLYPKNIGDIEVNEKDTVFQIHKAAIKRLDQVNNKLYNGKKLYIQVIKYK
jgi:ATP-dependent RNA helicase DeaD